MTSLGAEQTVAVPTWATNFWFRKIATVFACAALAILPAGAASSRAGRLQYERCTNDAMTNNELVACSRKEIDRLNEILDATFHRLLAKMAPEARPFLDKAQRAWAEYRDAECDYAATQACGIGSLSAPISYNTCEIEMIEARNKTLESDLVGLNEPS